MKSRRKKKTVVQKRGEMFKNRITDKGDLKF